MVGRLILGIVAAYVFVQITKVIFLSFKYKRFAWDAVFLPGGMPSVHSALVASLATGVYLSEGWTDLSVATFIFSAIVVYDAMTLRREVSVQKMLLDKLNMTILKMQPKTVLPKGHIGHTPIEVAVGLVLGVLGPVIIYAL